MMKNPQLHISRRGLGRLGLTAAVLGATSFTPAYADDRLVTATDLRLDSAEFARLYGPGTFVICSLANTVIGVQGRYDRIVSNRFRSLVTGQLAKVRLYWPTGKGYASGNGGEIRVRVLPDDGTAEHLPVLDATPVAQAVYTPDLGAKNNSDISDLAFTAHSGGLVRGQLYHMVFDNLDPQPAVNYSSIDHQSVPTSIGRPARWLNTTDWSVLLGSRLAGSSHTRKWINLTKEGSGGKTFSPIMQLTTVDGASQGVSDVESGSVVGRTDNTPDSRVFYATKDRPIRELFVPSTAKTVTGVSFALSTTQPASLQWRITHQDQQLATGTITQPTANYTSYVRGKSRLANFVWYDLALPTPVAMTAGASYAVELHPTQDSQWIICGHRNGSVNGFTWPAAFTESNAQHRLGSQWIDTNFRDLNSPRTDTNWPVVLHLAP